MDKLAVLRRRSRKRKRLGLVQRPQSAAPQPTVQVVVNVGGDPLPSREGSHGVAPGRPGQRLSDDRLHRQIRPYPG